MIALQSTCVDALSSWANKFTQGPASCTSLTSVHLPHDSLVQRNTEPRGMLIHKEDLPNQGWLRSWWSERTASCKRPHRPPSGSSCTQTRWCPWCVCGGPQHWTPCSLDHTQGSVWCCEKRRVYKINLMQVSETLTSIQNHHPEVPCWGTMNTALHQCVQSTFSY